MCEEVASDSPAPWPSMVFYARPKTTDSEPGGWPPWIVGTGSCDGSFLTPPGFEVPEFRIPGVHPDALDVIGVS